ncbi:hypothetical protein EJB05_19488, partial [Eragrostis curvula]
MAVSKNNKAAEIIISTYKPKKKKRPRTRHQDPEEQNPTRQISLPDATAPHPCMQGSQSRSSPAVPAFCATNKRRQRRRAQEEELLDVLSRADRRQGRERNVSWMAFVELLPLLSPSLSSPFILCHEIVDSFRNIFMTLAREMSDGRGREIASSEMCQNSSIQCVARVLGLPWRNQSVRGVNREGQQTRSPEHDGPWGHARAHSAPPRESN